MSWLEEKYAHRISGELRNFKSKRSNRILLEFSCPICGDSAKDERKARCYIYEKEDQLKVKCHNCGYTNPFFIFLKEINPLVYKEYVVEKFGEKNRPKKKEDRIFSVGGDPKTKLKTNLESPLRVLEDLPEKAIAYLEGRKIPSIDDIRYLSDMKKLLPFLDGEMDLYSEERIVIPILNRQGDLTGVSCRTMDADNKLRYINLKFSEESLFYNIQNVNRDDKVFVLEGILDSKFVNNSISVCGSDLLRSSDVIDKENLVLIFDNQPRNKEIINKMVSAVKQNFSIVIWPKDFEKNGKDINQMVQNGIDMNLINQIIRENTFSKMKASLKLNSWRKV